MTLISVQIGLGWHPSGIPDGIALFNIVVVSIAVERNIVITVSRQTKKLCIFIEAVAAAGVGNQCGVLGEVITYSLFASSKYPNFMCVSSI